MRIEIGMKLSGKWEWKVSVIIGIVWDERRNKVTGMGIVRLFPSPLMSALAD